jgi:hypothetical protein
MKVMDDRTVVFQYNGGVVVVVGVGDVGVDHDVRSCYRTGFFLTW